MCRYTRMDSNRDAGNVRWPVHPRPITGECLSSWFVRCAISNGMDPRPLWSGSFGRATKPTKHLDSSPATAVLKTLSLRSGLGVEEIRAMTLQAFQPFLAPEWKFGKMRWVLIGTDGPKSGTIQYCPLCLKERQFFRSVDRISLSVCCSTHGIPLQDCCPSCGLQVDLLRFGERFGGASLSLCHCRRCGWDLRQNPGRGNWDEDGFPLLPEAMGLQERILAGLEDGWMEFPGVGKIYTYLFLRGVRQILNLLSNRVTSARLKLPRRGNSLDTQLGTIP